MRLAKPFGLACILIAAAVAMADPTPPAPAKLDAAAAAAAAAADISKPVPKPGLDDFFNREALKTAIALTKLKDRVRGWIP